MCELKSKSARCVPIIDRFILIAMNKKASLLQRHTEVWHVRLIPIKRTLRHPTKIVRNHFLKILIAKTFISTK